jgi:hypothetical protein
VTGELHHRESDAGGDEDARYDEAAPPCRQASGSPDRGAPRTPASPS